VGKNWEGKSQLIATTGTPHGNAAGRETAPQGKVSWEGDSRPPKNAYLDRKEGRVNGV